MNLFTKQKQTNRYCKLMVPKEEMWREGINQEFTVNIITALYIKLITNNKDLLYTAQGTLLNIMQ